MCPFCVLCLWMHLAATCWLMYLMVCSTTVLNRAPRWCGVNLPVQGQDKALLTAFQVNRNAQAGLRPGVDCRTPVSRG